MIGASLVNKEPFHILYIGISVGRVADADDIVTVKCCLYAVAIEIRTY